MEQKDYLMIQIEQFGQVLGKLLADLLSLKNTPKLKFAENYVNEAFNAELNLNFDEIVSLSSSEIIEKLKKESKYSEENLEKIADLFMFIAENEIETNTSKKLLYQKSLEIFENLNSGEIYSMERFFKIQQISSKL